MNYSHSLISASLVKRYKRFLADVVLDDGTPLTVHVPNTGSLMGCVDPGLPVRLSDSLNDQRKYRYTLEQVILPTGRVGVNTHIANQLVGESLKGGLLPSFKSFKSMQAEVKYGQENSRIDWLLTDDFNNRCFVEVKNVTAAVENGIGFFPDAPSERATKHCRELVRIIEEGARAAIIFCVQRSDVTEVQPAEHIDPVYAKALRDAQRQGVELYALGADLSDTSVHLVRELPVRCAL
ncbi:MAG: DNA/RNA nuclease SfsA [Betaproteobacteria bacterium]|nr:DNA/RNA nuclease SfsA [Betaproteobacteria bacterium]MDE2423565.1 DNA/RNA nuclease SfsA [Betaproteobacteria bacterium]